MSRRRILNVEIESENLHDRSTDIADIFIEANGKEKSYAGWSATDKIKVTAGDYIIKRSSDAVLSSTSTYNYAYNTAGGGVSFQYAVGAMVDTILHIPEGVEYIRLSDVTHRLEIVEIYRVIK